MRANSAAGTSIFMLHGFYFLFYGLQGISIPFLPLWFAQRGLSSEQIGLIVASAFLPKILSAPLFAHIADLTGKASTLIYVSLAATLILFLCYPLTHTFLALLALTLLINALIPATQPLLDRMAITGGPGRGQSYAVIRALGSVGFAILTVAGGTLIKTYGVDWVLWLSLFLLLICLACVHRLPFSLARTLPPAETTPGPRFPILSVLKDRPLMLCIVAAALVQASNGFLYSYSTLYWIDNGLSTALISLLWSVGIASEVLFFLIARKIVVRVGALNLILISAAVSALRWAGLASTLDPTYMAILQVLQCFTLAGNTASIMWHIGQRVDAANKTSAIAFYTMLSGGFFMFGSIQLAGAAYRWHGPAGFLMMAAFSALAMPLVAYSMRLAKRR